MDLTLATREVDGRAIVAVGGEIDVYTAPKLRDCITELVGAGTYDIVIDLEAVEFLDSTGLGVLVEASRRFAPTTGRSTSSARRSACSRSSGSPAWPRSSSSTTRSASRPAPDQAARVPTPSGRARGALLRVGHIARCGVGHPVP